MCVYVEENNIKWIKEIGKEYLEWYKVIGENMKFKFDGLKYINFYKKDKVIYVYYGVIYILGNKVIRDVIVKVWEVKKWEDFYKYGISYKKFFSVGKYKY